MSTVIRAFRLVSQHLRRSLVRCGPVALLKRVTWSRAMRDAGMSTAEYAIGTLAACAFAALLYKVVTSSTVLQLLTGLVTRALKAPF
ncbi:MAG: DUF4244 domain-containing protein [Acidothermus cellulolyticus]|nr:DUF4244 domain-containing protein [Acidothermus cellulolyticus]MCL6551183.1 DUF4244 domain-containing protein [Acidothermus cellulolyticus]